MVTGGGIATIPCGYRGCAPAPRPAIGQFRIFPTGTLLILCEPCRATLEATGLHLIPVLTSWVAQAIRSALPTRVDIGR